MKSRLIILIVLLGLRVAITIVSGAYVPDGGRIKLTGDIDRIDINISKCIIRVEKFLIEIDSCETFSQGQNVTVFGTYKRRMIDLFKGEFYLSDAKIETNTLSPRKEKSVGDLSTIIDNMREKLTKNYYKHLPYDEAGLVAGIVFGDKSGIGRSLYEEMVNSGTIHIAVASGYNLMLVGGAFLGIFLWFVRRAYATVLTIAVIFLYAVLAGGEPPVMRALIMSAMVFIGLSLGRGQFSWWALIVAMWLMMMWDFSLLFSVSFQLSAAASIGLMIIDPKIKIYIDTLNNRLTDFMGDIGLTTTVSTMLLTVPIIWFHFGRFNLMGLISNIVVLPLVPPLMILGGLMVFTGGLLTVPVYIISHAVVVIIGILGR